MALGRKRQEGRGVRGWYLCGSSEREKANHRRGGGAGGVVSQTEGLISRGVVVLVVMVADWWGVWVLCDLRDGGCEVGDRM